MNKIIQLTDNEAKELKDLIGSYDKTLAEIDDLEEVKKHLLALKKLDFYYNLDLTMLPESICKLGQLKFLDLTHCENLTMLPENISNLKGLQHLILSHCYKLETLPKSIGQLSNLEGLYLFECSNIKSLPDSVGELKNLQLLVLSYCYELESLPNSLGGLRNLKELYLNDCKNLNSLPDSICELTNLKSLSLSNCQKIKNLPENIGQLTNLEDLWCNYKKIDYLPLSFSNLQKLKEDYLRIALEEINKIQNEEKKIFLLNILLYVLKIREELTIKNHLHNHEYKYMYEDTVAHYTTPYVAMKLLKQEKNKNENEKNKPNLFQLGNVSQFNDPKEGKVIFDYFNNLDILKDNNIILKPVSQLATFVGCFTFNHDKLNHFRLYGKIQGKEATGVSIVVDNKYFDDFKHQNTLFITDYKIIDKNKQELPLYRCIYLEPKSSLNGKTYIKVAHRDEITFYREKGGDPSKNWKEYIEYIEDIQKTINEQFKKIQKSIESLFKDINKKNEEELIEEKLIEEELIETVSFILMPLSYMVKHSAYEEEQECRIFKFLPSSNINNENIDIDNGRMYVEYLPINDCVKKIYLAPHSGKYADIFRVLTNGKVEVRLSDNPFR